MEIKQLESFVTACERGSLSQAAACMYTCLLYTSDAADE